jgi:hypothetical protein
MSFSSCYAWLEAHTHDGQSKPPPHAFPYVTFFFLSLSLHILVLPGELIRLRQGKRRQRDRGVMGMCIEIKIVTFSEEERKQTNTMVKAS